MIMYVLETVDIMIYYVNHLSHFDDTKRYTGVVLDFDVDFVKRKCL